MSAADLREELEARMHERGIPRGHVRVLLAVADDYAAACVTEAGGNPDNPAACRRRREEATAEYFEPGERRPS